MLGMMVTVQLRQIIPGSGGSAIIKYGVAPILVAGENDPSVLYRDCGEGGDRKRVVIESLEEGINVESPALAVQIW